MRGMETGKTEIRHRVFTEIARLAYEGGDYAEALEELTYKIRPGDPDEAGSYRGSVLYERAVIGERLRLAMGLPMGLQYSITAIGSVILQTAVNTLGSGAVAAMTAGSRISMFMMCPFDALGSTMATYGGQNVGAGKYDRLASGMKSATILAAVYSAAILVVIIFLARPLIYLFIDPSDSANITQVVAQARQFLITNTCFYMLLSLVNIVRFLIQGMGFSGFAVFAGVFEMIARALIGLIFVPIFGFTAACFASPLAWLFADCFLLPAFFHCRKKLMRGACQ